MSSTASLQFTSAAASDCASCAVQGWLFNICDDPQRCVSDPTLGLSVWFRQLWLVRVPRIPKLQYSSGGLFVYKPAPKCPGATHHHGWLARCT